MADVAKNRNVYLDSACGILLIHMIIAHCCQWEGQSWAKYEYYTYFLAFFMPWFFFKAGVFYRQRPFSEELKISFKRLLVPFVVFTFVGSVAFWIDMAVHGDFQPSMLLKSLLDLCRGGSCFGNLPLWFLSSLFAVRIIYNLIGKCRRTIAIPIKSFMALVIPAISLFIPLSDYRIPLYLLNIPLGFAFFWIGNALDDKFLERGWSWVLIIGYALWCIGYPTFVDIHFATLIFGSWILYLPYTLLGIWAINALCRMILNKNNIFSYIGRNSMPYYVLHWIVLICVSFFFPFEDPPMAFLWWAIGANIIVLPLLTIAIRRLGGGWAFGE